MRARPVIPGKTYLLTRRTADRRFFLRPGEALNDVVRYELARAAAMFGVQVHGFVVMSNHVHLVVTDALGLLPYFMHGFCLQVAKAGSSIIGRWGGFWAQGKYSRVEILDADALVRKLAYVIANPTQAGLVRRAIRWPGLTSAGMMFGDEAIVQRPNLPFYERSRKPLVVAFALVAPPRIDPGVCRVKVELAVREIENAAAADLKARHRKFVGERRILSQNPHDCATAWEKRRGLDPTFSSKDKWARLEAAQRNLEWSLEYDMRRDLHRLGFTDVLFPPGTWQMVQLYCCRVDDMSGYLAA